MRLQNIAYKLVIGAASLSRAASLTAESEAGAALACPATVGTGDIAPYAIVPISQRNTRKAYGTSATASVTSKDVCTWFAFQTPANLPNSICVLSFIFPDQSDLSNPSYNITSGGGTFDFFAKFYSPGEALISAATTWDNQPFDSRTSASMTYRNKLSPNTVTAISTGSCSRNGANLELFVRMCSNDADFSFVQSTSAAGQCPFGLFLLMFPKR